MPGKAFNDFMADSEPNLTVLTADGGRIRAHAEVLRLVCSCLKNAPASDTWDLRQLLVDGTPVTAETVTSVFEVVYDGLHSLDFEMNKVPDRFSLQQLHSMLLFADAVGCSKGFLNNMCTLLSGCLCRRIEVAIRSIPEEAGSGSTGSMHSVVETASATAAAAPTSLPGTQCVSGGGAVVQTVSLHVGRIYSLEFGVLYGLDCGRKHRAHIADLTLQQQKQLRVEIAQQLESLLYTAFRLRVKELQEWLLLFLRNNTAYSEAFCNPILSEQATSVLTTRVLSAAGVGAAELVSRACLQTPLGRGFGIGTLFQLDYGDIPPCIKFNATLLRDFGALYKGKAVTVAFDADTDSLSVVERGVASGVVPLKYVFGTVVGPSSSIEVLRNFEADDRRDE